MDEERARRLLAAERSRVQRLLTETESASQQDRAEANEPGDLSDPAERLTAEESDDAVASGLRERLAALDRAESRIMEGTFGYSVRSGLPIPEARSRSRPRRRAHRRGRTADLSGSTRGLRRLVPSASAMRRVHGLHATAPPPAFLPGEVPWRCARAQ